jgi:hypothetical protein
VKERRGPLGQLSGLAENVVGAVRRRQRGREPRVILYDAEGHPQVLRPSADEHPDIVEKADDLIGLTRRDGRAAEPESPA